jgi:hypothetical protein
LEKELKNSNTIYQRVHKYYKLDSSKNDWLYKNNYFTPAIEKMLEMSKKNGSNKQKKISYQYIPILDSIKSIFQNDQLKEIYFNNCMINSHEAIHSFNQSSNFKNNELFQNDRHALQIILFMD